MLPTWSGRGPHGAMHDTGSHEITGHRPSGVAGWNEQVTMLRRSVRNDESKPAFVKPEFADHFGTGRGKHDRVGATQYHLAAINQGFHRLAELIILLLTDA